MAFRSSLGDLTAVSDKVVPRIVVATNMYPSLGDPAWGAFVRAQVEALQQLGTAVDVLTIDGRATNLNYVKGIYELRRRVADFRADFVYAFYGLTGWVALWQPAPVILSLAGDDILGTPDGRGGITTKSRVGVFLSQWAAWRAKVICVQSEEMRQRLWGGMASRAHVVPYGVDPQRFHPGDKSAARRRLGIPVDEKLVIFPNTPQEPRKRLDLAEAAMKLVAREIPVARLRIVTKVPHGDMPDYFRAADCCLLTSDWEGSPNVVKEALMSGVPVVTTDVGDVRRWIPLASGSSITGREPADIAKGILQAFDSPRHDPRPFVDAISSRAMALEVLALATQLGIEKGPR